MTDPCDVCAEPDPVKRRAAELRQLDGDKWLAEIARHLEARARIVDLVSVERTEEP